MCADPVTVWLGAALILLALTVEASAAGRTYYVATTGDDSGPGTPERPWKTIQHAAETMQPGDTVLIRGGTYRECVQPARGGAAEDARITYRAFPGERPIIKGSERITGWRDEGRNVWKVEIPDDLFGDYNPYTTNLEGPWLAVGQDNHVGEVYLDGKPLSETPRQQEVYEAPYTWFASHRDATTYLYANFSGNDPNDHETEVLVRECCFLPRVDGLKYLTLDGLTFMHAASGWIYNTGFQKGAVNTRLGFGWVIENCHIADCKTVGISSGLTGTRPGDMEQYGHHVFRRNLVERCGQSGFSGNTGYAASLIEGNLIQDINYRGQFGGWETAGIKIHFAIDVTIKNNVIRRIHNDAPQGTITAPGIWLDWAAQGSRITGNVLSEIDDRAIYLEASHGPILLDNNVIIDNVVDSDCERVILAHNLFVNSGLRYQNYEDRRSEYWVPHTRTRAGSSVRKYTGDRYFNNIYIGKGAEQSRPTDPENPPDFRAGHNVFYHGAQPSQWDIGSIVEADFHPEFTKTDLPNGVALSFSVTEAPLAVKAPLINRDFIGVYDVVNQGIEDHEGRGITVDTDLLGHPRQTTHPTAGPFETLKAGARNAFTFTAGPVGTPVVFSAPPLRDPEPAAQDEYAIRRLPALASAEAVASALQRTAAKVIRYGAPLARVRYALAGEDLAIHIEVYDARIALEMEQWPDSTVDVLCSRPGSQIVRQVVFHPQGPDVGKVTLYENGNQLGEPAVRWQASPLPGGGYVLAALIPLSVVMVDADAGVFLFECAVCAAPATGGPVQYRTLFHSVNAYTDNSRFGRMVIE